MKGNVLAYTVRIVMVTLAVAWHGDAFSQKHPERRLIRSGNRSYEAQDYLQGEEKYRAAQENNPVSFEAAFNLADALYKQERFDEAAQLLEPLAEDPLLSSERKAKVYHNLGNVMFSRQKLNEALNYYKRSLRENPADLETKYNLAYVQKLMEEQNRDGGGQDNEEGNDNQDNGNGGQESDTEQNGNGDERQDGGEQGENDDDESSDGQSGDSGKPEPENTGEEENRAGISHEDAENILGAMQQQEDKTRERVNEQKAVGVGRSGKNW